MTFIPNCTKSMEKSVWVYNMYENGAKSSKKDIQTSMKNSVLMAIDFRRNDCESGISNAGRSKGDGSGA